MADVKELQVNNQTYDIKAKSVVDTNSGSVKMWTGTRQQYDAITTKDATTLYNTDNGLYLGTTEVANISGNRNIGEIVESIVPLTDAGLHLLDGALINGSGIYSAFVDYMASLYYSTASTGIYYIWQATYNEITYTTQSRVKTPTINDYYYSNYGTTQVQKFADLSQGGVTWQVDSNGKIYYAGNEAILIGTGAIGNVSFTPPNYFAQASDVAWVQPILTANGTMGGDSFAVSSNVAQYSGEDVYNAFNGVTSSGNGFHSQSGTTTGYIDMYNPTPIKITNFKIYNQNAPNRASSAGTIYGSNDGTTWTEITTYTNSVQTAGGIWDISLSTNTAYYKYYRMQSTAAGSDSDGYWTIWEIEITAWTQASAEEVWQSSVTSYGVCGKFVYDSANNTVRLPKITGILEGTTDITALGDLIEQYVKLPNITGYTQQIRGVHLEDVPSGALNWSNEGGDTWGGYGTGNIGRITFDASLSSSVYSGNGTDTKIQQQAIKCFYYIVIATTTKTEIEVDIDEIATDLNGKADVDLTNTSAALSGNFLSKLMPDYDNAITITSVPYTAPCAGVCDICVSGSDIVITVNGVNVARDGIYVQGSSSRIIVDKNDIITTANGALDTVSSYPSKFFPLKGAN